MELMISFKSGKYIVQDKGAGRQIYTIKKKGFGASRYVLMDPSNYQLYSMSYFTNDNKPTFIISHNDNSILHINCKSKFLDPTLTVTGRDIQGTVINYEIASKDHRNFNLIKDGSKVGFIKTNVTVNQELQYDIEIENKVFDDYIPLFILAVDLTFGDLNRGMMN